MDIGKLTQGTDVIIPKEVRSLPWGGEVFLVEKDTKAQVVGVNKKDGIVLVDIPNYYRLVQYYASDVRENQ